MDGNVGKLMRRIEALFPERQLFIRANGRVRFFVLSRNSQMAITAVPLAIGLILLTGIVVKVIDAWTIARLDETWRIELAHLDASWQARYRVLARERDGLVHSLDESRATLEIERKAAESKYKQAIEELAERQRRFAVLLAQRQELESETRRLGVAVDTARTRREAAERSVEEMAKRQRRFGVLLAQRQELESETRRLGVAVKTARTRREAAERSAEEMEERYRKTRDRLTLSGLARLEPAGSLRSDPPKRRLVLGGGAETAIPREPVALSLGGIGAEELLEGALADRQSAERSAAKLRARFNRLEARLANLRDTQSSLIAQIEGGATGRISEIESVIQLTGLSVELLVGRAQGNIAEGIGGALAVLAGVPKGPWELGATPATHPDLAMTLEHHLDRSIVRLGARLARWSALNAVMERLPIAAPLAKYNLTSRFGKRRDPFTKRWAMHSGVDLGAPRRSRIRAVAPGTVSQVGWKGPYGRLIEIDHGYGLKTRYGHLYRTRVKRGERVTLGQEIAIIGSSGRSTGRHLHYEVRFDDRPLDPRTFLKAGKHVLKDGQK